MRTASLGMSNDRENVMKLEAGHSTLCKYGSSAKPDAALLATLNLYYCR
jgi:hypothetical protein